MVRESEKVDREKLVFEALAVMVAMYISTLLIRLKTHVEKLSGKSIHLFRREYLTLGIRVLDEPNEPSFLLFCQF